MVNFANIWEIAFLKCKIVPNEVQRILTAFMKAIGQDFKTSYRSHYYDYDWQCPKLLLICSSFNLLAWNLKLLQTSYGGVRYHFLNHMAQALKWTITVLITTRIDNVPNYCRFDVHSILHAWNLKLFQIGCGGFPEFILKPMMQALNWTIKVLIPSRIDRVPLYGRFHQLSRNYNREI